MPTVRVNGADHQFDGDPQLPLLWYLRDFLGLTGSKFGCGMGLCGACTVHQDGVAILLRAKKSPPSKPSPRPPITPFKKLGANSMFPSAATANPAR